MFSNKMCDNLANALVSEGGFLENHRGECLISLTSDLKFFSCFPLLPKKRCRRTTLVEEEASVENSISTPCFIAPCLEWCQTWRTWGDCEGGEVRQGTTYPTSRKIIAFIKLGMKAVQMMSFFFHTKISFWNLFAVSERGNASWWREDKQIQRKLSLLNTILFIFTFSTCL